MLARVAWRRTYRWRRWVDLAGRRAKASKQASESWQAGKQAGRQANGQVQRWCCLRTETAVVLPCPTAGARADRIRIYITLRYHSLFLSLSPGFNRHLRVTVVDPAADERFLEKPTRSRPMRRDATCRTPASAGHGIYRSVYLYTLLSPFSSGWLLSAHARERDTYLSIYVCGCFFFNYASRVGWEEWVWKGILWKCCVRRIVDRLMIRLIVCFKGMRYSRLVQAITSRIQST